MSVHCTIQTGRPALFAGLTLASGVGVVALAAAGEPVDATTARAPFRLAVLAGGAAGIPAARPGVARPTAH